MRSEEHTSELQSHHDLVCRLLLEKMPPFLSGGDMIASVHEQSTTYAPVPRKFEAGTRNVGGEVGLAAAIQ